MLNLCCQFPNSFFTLNRSTLQSICWVYYFYKYIFCTWYLQLCFYSVFLTPAQIFKFFSYPLMVFCILILNICPARIHSFCIIWYRWFCTWSFFYKACVLGGCNLQRLPANEAPAFSFCLPVFGSCACARVRQASQDSECYDLERFFKYTLLAESLPLLFWFSWPGMGPKVQVFQSCLGKVNV